MFIFVDKRMFNFTFGALLLLISMQFAAIVHANEHALNSTEQLCIIHLELSKFSDLILANSSILAVSTQIFIPYLLINRSIFPTSSANYLSRAPPSVK